MSKDSWNWDKVADISDYRPTPNSPVTTRVVDNKDGSRDTYSNSKDLFNSTTHSHKNEDKNGNVKYDRPEGTKKSSFWGYTLEALSSLSFAELQIVETMSSNEYVKRSARHLIDQASFGPVLDFEMTLNKTKF